MVPTGGGEALAIGSEGHTMDVTKIGLAAQGQQFLSALRIPHLRLETGGGQVLAIRTEGHTPHSIDMGAQGQQFLSALRIPHLRGRVSTSGGQVFAIRTEQYIFDTV